jgi:hypothetical protein
VNFRPVETPAYQGAADISRRVACRRLLVFVYLGSPSGAPALSLVLEAAGRANLWFIARHLSTHRQRERA